MIFNINFVSQDASIIIESQWRCRIMIFIISVDSDTNKISFDA